MLYKKRKEVDDKDFDLEETYRQIRDEIKQVGVIGYEAGEIENMLNEIITLNGAE